MAAVLDRHGRLLREVRAEGGTRARWVPLEELGPTVVAALLAGCAAGMQTYAKGKNPVAVAADAVAVYFLDFGGRALLRVAR